MPATAFVADPPQTFALYKDTTIALMWAAQARGDQVWHIAPQDLGVVQGRARALATQLVLKIDKQILLDASPPKDLAWYEVKEQREIWLEELDSVHVRQDPPFNMRYIYVTYALSVAEKAGCMVVNSPSALRDFNEKYSLVRFPQVSPPFEISSQEKRLIGFAEQHPEVIFKPLDGMAGLGIFRTSVKDPNIKVIIETLTSDGKTPIMAQRYIPEISAGDKRVFVICGKVIPYMLVRIPNPEDGRGNLVRGARGISQPLGAVERTVAETVAPDLLAQGLYVVGLDIIGDYLSEINVTSPTGMREIHKQSGFDLATELLEAVAQLKVAKA